LRLASPAAICPVNFNVPERPLSKSGYVRKGHQSDLPIFGFIAGKESVEFRFPEAVIPIGKSTSYDSREKNGSGRSRCIALNLG
jgi:hypothetical protein